MATFAYVRLQDHIPSVITLLNLFCGCAAIIFLIYEEWETAFILMGFSLLADYLDGLAARVLRATSEMGRELDSLADMVSFGVVPGIILFQILVQNLELETRERFWSVLPALPAFMLTLFSALRLARFNLDIRQTQEFIGLTTPSATIFVVGLAMIIRYEINPMAEHLSNPYLIYFIIGVLCYLLLAQLPMFSLKFAHYRWVGNEIRYIFIALSIGLIFLTKGSAPTWIIFIYLLLNAATRWLRRKRIIEEL